MPPDKQIEPPDRPLGLGGPLLDALGAMPVPMWVADRLGRVRWMNVAAMSLVGSRLDSHFSGLIAPEFVADARELYARKLDGRLDYAVQQVSLVTAAGPAAVELTSVPIRGDEGVVGVITLVREAPASTVRRRPKPRLSPRQHQVLELLAQGRSTAEIARQLEISEDTVRNHIRYLLTELRVRTRLEAVVVAFRNDWL